MSLGTLFFSVKVLLMKEFVSHLRPTGLLISPLILWSFWVSIAKDWGGVVVGPNRFEAVTLFLCALKTLNYCECA